MEPFINLVAGQQERSCAIDLRHFTSHFLGICPNGLYIAQLAVFLHSFDEGFPTFLNGGHHDGFIQQSFIDTIGQA